MAKKKIKTQQVVDREAIPFRVDAFLRLLARWTVEEYYFKPRFKINSTDSKGTAQ